MGKSKRKRNAGNGAQSSSSRRRRNPSKSHDARMNVANSVPPGVSATHKSPGGGDSIPTFDLFSAKNVIRKDNASCGADTKQDKSAIRHDYPGDDGARSGKHQRAPNDVTKQDKGATSDHDSGYDGAKNSQRQCTQTEDKSPTAPKSPSDHDSEPASTRRAAQSSIGHGNEQPEVGTSTGDAKALAPGQEDAQARKENADAPREHWGKKVPDLKPGDMFYTLTKSGSTHGARHKRRRNLVIYRQDSLIVSIMSFTLDGKGMAGVTPPRQPDRYVRYMLRQRRHRRNFLGGIGPHNPILLSDEDPAEPIHDEALFCLDDFNVLHEDEVIKRLRHKLCPGQLQIVLALTDRYCCGQSLVRLEERKTESRMKWEEIKLEEREPSAHRQSIEERKIKSLTRWEETRSEEREPLISPPSFGFTIGTFNAPTVSQPSASSKPRLDSPVEQSMNHATPDLLASKPNCLTSSPKKKRSKRGEETKMFTSLKSVDSGLTKATGDLAMTNSDAPTALQDAGQRSTEDTRSAVALSRTSLSIEPTIIE